MNLGKEINNNLMRSKNHLIQNPCVSFYCIQILNLLKRNISYKFHTNKQTWHEAKAKVERVALFAFFMDCLFFMEQVLCVSVVSSTTTTTHQIFGVL